MACVLVRPATFRNPFAGQHVIEEQVQNLSWNKYDWINASPSPTPLPVVEPGSSKDLQSSEVLETKGTKCEQDVNDTPAPLPTPATDADATNSNGSRKGVKRKVSEIECDFEEILRPPKRISPFFNTPKERKDEKRKILKMSVQKIKLIENAELCLRRSVLINNTMQRMRRELKKDSYTRKRKRRLGQGMLNNDCLSESYLVDDPFLSGIHEKITDDMTDVLMSNLEKKLGADIASNSNAGDNTSDDNSSVQKICKTSETETKDHNEKICEEDLPARDANVTEISKTSAIVDKLSTSINVNFTNKNENETVTSEDCDTPENAIKVNLPSENNEVMFETLINNNAYSESNGPKFSERTR